MYEYRVKEVTKVVDGDTVDVIVDLGFDILHKTRVRLYGINAPESRTRDLEEKARGIMAKERLKELVASSSLILSTEEKGKFGRYLGIFYKDEDQDNRVNINETMVKEGHATDYFGGKR